MSGPKRTCYSISQRLYQQQKREQQLRRQKQIGEIEDKLKNSRKKLNKFINKNILYLLNLLSPRATLIFSIIF